MQKKRYNWLTQITIWMAVIMLILSGCANSE